MTDDRTRRHVTLMVIPLGVIALGLLAAVLVPYSYPMKWMTVVAPLEDGFSPFHIIYIGAGVLAVSIGLASRRGSTPGHIATVTALITILAATALTAIAVYSFSDGGYWTQVLVFVAPIAITLVITFHALRMRGWDRMLFLCGAFAVAALPFSCPLVPGTLNVFSGGLVYLAADVTVLVLFLRGVVR